MAALLCVLLAHALIVFLLWIQRADVEESTVAGFVSEPITLFLPPPEPEPVAPSDVPAPSRSQPRPVRAPQLESDASPTHTQPPNQSESNRRERNPLKVTSARSRTLAHS